MIICNKIEELICANCIYSAPSEEEEGWIYCQYGRGSTETMFDNTYFCHRGEWPCNVIIERDRWDDEKKENVVYETERTIKCLDRSSGIQAFANGGKFEW